MFIRVIITKFPNDNKKQLALAFISTVTPKFQNDSKLLDLQILDVEEAKILNIAKYNNKKNFEDTDIWLKLLFALIMKELDGLANIISVEVMFSWIRQMNKV